MAMICTAELFDLRIFRVRVRQTVFSKHVTKRAFLAFVAVFCLVIIRLWLTISSWLRSLKIASHFFFY